MSRDHVTLRKKRKEAVKMALRYLDGDALHAIAEDYGITASTCRQRVNKVFCAGKDQYLHDQNLSYNFKTKKYTPHVDALNDPKREDYGAERKFPEFWRARVKDAAITWGLLDADSRQPSPAAKSTKS